MVGEVLRVSAGEVLLAGRRGEVTVPWPQVVACRRVPPRRLPEPHRHADVDEVTLVAAGGWAAVHTEALGDWRLRWADGFSKRANSALAVGGPGTATDVALDLVGDWYAARSLPARVQLADSPLADVLAPQLARHGFVPADETLFMTAASARVAGDVGDAGDRGPGGDVIWSAVPGDGWEEAYAREHPRPTPVARQVLLGAGATFARMEQGDRVVAVGRLTVGGGWAGLTCLWVDPGVRRRGLATALTRAMATRAQEQGAGSLHLQVEADNPGALELYQRLGFTTHHRYRYWTQPQAASWSTRSSPSAGTTTSPSSADSSVSRPR